MPDVIEIEVPEVPGFEGQLADHFTIKLQRCPVCGERHQASFRLAQDAPPYSAYSYVGWCAEWDQPIYARPATSQ